MSYPNGTGADAAFIRNGTADARTVAQIRHEFSHWLRAHFALDAVRLNDILLAVNEALTNSAEFAYVGLRRGTMTVNAHCHPDGDLRVVVSDHGTWRHVEPGARSNTRGRGIPLMRALSDHMAISRQPTGTTVHMRFGDCARVARQACATPA
jgi:anti-sigma regulatory factor (Ser/Thr protein kinase)